MEQKIIQEIISGTTIEGDYTEPYDYPLYNIFSINAASDIAPYMRSFDSELKWIFDFLNTTYDTGDHFVITIKSLMYPCPSCRRYLASLKVLAELEGKTFDIKFIANRKASSSNDVCEILNINQ